LQRQRLGSARRWRAGFGCQPKRTLNFCLISLAS
jgi:hypothetical protein